MKRLKHFSFYRRATYIICASYSALTFFSASNAFAASTPIYRLYNRVTGEHFLTASLAEAVANGCPDPGYVMESADYFMTDNTDAPGATTVSRMFNPVTGDRFYSLSANEITSAIANGYIMETPDAFLAESSFPPGGGLGVYQLYNNKLDRHLYTWNYAEVLSAGAAGYTNEGTAFWLDSNPTYVTIPVARLYNPQTGDHLYTADQYEINAVNCLKPTYVNEGQMFVASQDSSTGDSPVFRLRAPNGFHIFTISVNEKNQLLSKGYALENSAAFYASTAIKTGYVPVYRLYSNQSGDHLFTTDQGEHVYALSHGYVDEGIAFYVPTQ